MEASWWEKLTEGKLGLVLMGQAMFNKSLIQFSVDEWGCVPSLLIDLMPNYGGGNEDNGDLLQKVLCMHCCTHCPRPCSRPLLTHASTGDSWTVTASLGQSLVGSLLLSPGSSCAQVSVCALQESVSPVLCKFWRLYVGLNADLLQEGLSLQEVCWTQSPCPCGRPLLTHTFTGDTQTQFWLSLCGVSGCIQGLFEPSERHWQLRGLILNMILPLLSSCWGFSFALGCELSFFFFGGIQHSPVNDYSAASCSFGVLSGEDEHTREDLNMFKIIEIIQISEKTWMKL